MTPAPRDRWPEIKGRNFPFAVYWSKDFMVQLYAEPNDIVRLSVCRTCLGNDGHWIDGISWEELQDIKDGVGYGSNDAIEVYPRIGDVVNVANMRHLWVLPSELDFIWRRSSTT
ncbi:hypothetical protein GKE73_16130 [Paludibacterium sp. dN 18-1]|uniref:DUF7694 domain-containing protein n=1 Tax=Paludibacterium denitrificans TaxID=2675226 RepID=A0A844GFC0_9NEIS|nr:hypothetical protein [Paludibacterium denitrificans]